MLAMFKLGKYLFMSINMTDKVKYNNLSMWLSMEASNEYLQIKIYWYVGKTQASGSQFAHFANSFPHCIIALYDICLMNLFQVRC